MSLFAICGFISSPDVGTSFKGLESLSVFQGFRGLGIPKSYPSFGNVSQDAFGLSDMYEHNGSPFKSRMH